MNIPEAYGFNWVGKSAARAEAFRNVRADFTLRPSIEDSVNFDTTQNLYIEGDNLTVMKLLQESYLYKVKLIYIDPPYNTGNDFIYRDNFKMDTDEYNAEVELFDAEGNKNFRRNSDSNPRFHSDWCSMIYSRLLVARNFLTDDGVICISIDDHEHANLRKICDEVFGERNFVGEIIRKTKSMTGDNGCGFNLQHESLMIYARRIDKVFLNGEPKNYDNYANPDNDPNGEWCSGDPSARSGGKSTYFEIENPYTHKKDFPPVGRYWAFSKATLKSYIASGKISFKKSHRDNERGFIFKRYKNDITAGFEPVHSLFATDNLYMNQAATVEVKKSFGGDVFSYPKPQAFIKKIIQYATDKDSIVMDFFSGSATTAHAVMQLNAEDGGNRKFIMIQLPEKCSENSEAYKIGYRNICEIGRERIRRAGQKIKSESEHLDVGFRVLKLDTANFNQTHFSPEEWIRLKKENRLNEIAENIKSDRTASDLLFGCLIDWALPLHLSYSVEQVDGYAIQYYGDIIACFDKNIPRRIFEYMATKKPRLIIFRDAAFEDGVCKLNVMTYFKNYAADTKIEII